MVSGHDEHGLIRMEDDECWEFLAGHSLGRVGLVHLDEPMVFPVNYLVDGRSVVFRTAPGTKLAMAGTAGPVVFEVDEATELFETGTSVMVQGTMHEVMSGVEKDRLAKLPLHAWAPGDRDHIIRIEPDGVSGRQIPLHHQDDGVTADGG